MTGCASKQREGVSPVPAPTPSVTGSKGPLSCPPKPGNISITDEEMLPLEINLSPWLVL